MSLRVWLPLNRDLRNQGLENVAVTNNGATFSDGAANFDGSSSYISCGNPNIDGGNISAACWVYMITSAGGTNYIISLNDGAGFADHEIGLATDNRTILYFVAGGNSSLTSANIQLNTWTHLAVTYDGSTITGYINGISIGSVSHTTKLDRANLTIGARKNGTSGYTYYSNCKMYDARIYDHALSKKEVAELARGCILHYPMNDTLNESTVNLITSIGNTTRCLKEGNGVRIDWTKTENQGDTYFFFNTLEPVVTGQIYTLSFDAHGIISNGIRFDWSNLHDSQYQCFIKEGHNELTFTVGDVTTTFFDDINRDNTNNFWMGNFQLEKKDHATPFAGYGTTRTQQYLKDVSGFDNHSLITGSLPLVTTPKSPRYDKCMNIDNSGTNKNYANCTIAAPQVKSASFWVYIGSSNPSQQIVFGHRLSHMAFGFYGTNNCLTYIGEGSSLSANSQFDISNTKKNSWNHFVISQTDNLNIDLFLNGVKLTSTANQYWGYQTSDDLYIGRRMRGDGGDIMYYTGKLSDFRLFSRVLTQADVDDLYKDSLSIDKSQNGYCYELNESDAQSSVDVKKNGQLICKNYYEACPDTYDSNIYTEPDGSLWIRIFHHNNPANALFSSSDTFTTGVYKDADRWFKVSLCNNVSKWELMVKQKAESNSTEQKYRWVQNANPMTAAYTDVTNDKVTPITASGYLAFSSNFGGISLYSASVCYLRQNSNTNAGWWGAFGRVSAYNGGIENFTGSGGSQTIKSGYLDLYLRIDNLSTAEQATLFTDEGNQIARIGKNSNVSMNEIHEV